MILDRFLFLFQATEFNMKDAIYALVFTVIILGGLLIVEAIHKPKPRRSRRPDRRAQELIPPVISPTDADQFESTSQVSAPVSASTTTEGFSTPTHDTKPSIFKGVRWLWAIFVGFVGTLAMSIFYVTIGINTAPDSAKIDPPKDLAAFLTSQTGSQIELPVGWLIHLVVGATLGIVFALSFSKYFKTRPPILRGAAFGFIVWLIMQSMVMTMMDAGFFASNMGDDQSTILTVSLIGHLIFGMVLGFMYGGPREEAVDL